MSEEYDLVKVLNDPDVYYPGNFVTAEKAAAFLMCLCQEAAYKIQKLEATKKPLNGDEILEAFNATGFTNTDYKLRCFTEGVRFAEQHYGIGTIQCGKDESTMQSMCGGDKGMTDLAIWKPSACCSFRWVERPKTKPRGNEPGYVKIIEKVLQQLYVNTLKPEYEWRDVPTVKEDEE